MVVRVKKIKARFKLVRLNVLRNPTLIQTNLIQQLDHRVIYGISMCSHSVLKFSSIQEY